MSWSNELTLEFLDLYKQEQILWDNRHPHHKHRNNVTSAWMRIQSAMSAMNLDCTVIDIKRKKESLMTAFRFHVNRKKMDPLYEPTWFAYKSMESFLSGRYNVNESTNALDDEYFDGSDYKYTQSQTNTEPVLVTVQSHSAEKNNISSTEPKAKKMKFRNSLRHQPNDITTKISSKEITHEATNHEHRMTSSSELDEYELYGQLLAKKLRKLDEHQRDIAMHEIDNIMFRAKMDGATQSRTFTTSSPAPAKMKSPIYIVTQSNSSQYEDENITYQESGT